MVEKYSVKLNMEQLNIIGKALGKLTYDEAAPLIADINRQLMEATQPPTETGGEG